MKSKKLKKVYEGDYEEAFMSKSNNTALKWIMLGLLVVLGVAFSFALAKLIMRTSW